MFSKIYKNDIGTKILLDVGSDISLATVLKIKYKKSDGSVGEWIAIPEDIDKLFYITLNGDLDIAGIWIINAYVELPDWKGHGESAQFNVYEIYT